MRASLLTRAASLAAAAAIATTGAVAATGGAGASTHVKRLPTHLSITTIPAIEPPATQVTVITGHLGTAGFPLRDETVFLDRKSGLFFVDVAHERTDKSGLVAFVVNPKKTTQYVLVFKGSVNFSPSHSAIVTVQP
jgi:hypothetical protein